MAKKSNYNRKKDLIGESYTKGIKGFDGEQAIRPLNEEEKAYLEKFNDEFINGNFVKDGTDLHHNLIEDNKKEIKSLKRKLKKVNNELNDDNSGWRTMNGEEREAFSRRKEELHLMKNDLKGRLSEIDVLTMIRANNYSRGMDVSNYPNRTVKIADLEPANFIYNGEENCDNTDNETILFERLKVLNDV